MSDNLLSQRFSLPADCGIQFIDCPMVWPSPDEMRYFVRKTSAGPLTRVYAGSGKNVFRLPSASGGMDEIVRPEYQLPLSDCLRYYADSWLPVPFLREGCGTGPVNWVRAFITTPKASGQAPQLTLAFDTTTALSQSRHLQPDRNDCDNGQRFIPGWRDEDISGFSGLLWVNQWTEAVFRCRTPTDMPDLPRFTFQAHYLNLLELIGMTLPCHAVTLLPLGPAEKRVPVDLILDVGNSHSCGILSECHQNEDDPLLHCRELTLRDLSQPARRSSKLFDSNTVFADNPIDDPVCSAAGGRSSAFVWPSMVRTGDEAQRLTRRLNNSGGMQGISSPRRYMWDESPGHILWYYPPPASDPAGVQQPAINSPFTMLINDNAGLLTELSSARRFPVFRGHYPRSSLLMFMLCELLSQALCQMNSHQHRQQMPEYAASRYLRSVILTLPAALSTSGRERMLSLTRQALTLVRQSMTSASAERDRQAFRLFREPLPAVTAGIDEASGGQLLWLYPQLYADSAVKDPCEQLIKQRRLPHRTVQRDGLRIALIDIGGGTTDVSVTDYLPLPAAGNTGGGLRPELSYSAGYPLAGEDLLHDLISAFILPALQQYLTCCGFPRSRAILRQLFAPGISAGGDTPWRQQFTRQFLRPLAVAMLEQMTCRGQDSSSRPLFSGSAGELLRCPPDAQVIHYFIQRVIAISGISLPLELSEMKMNIPADDAESFFASDKFRLGRLLSAICDNVTKMQPDILLLSGKSAALPAVVRQIQRQTALPSGHIISLQGIPATESIPFCRGGFLEDGKCSAITGALIYQLISHQRLWPRYLRPGKLTTGNVICEMGVINDDYSLPAAQVVLRLPVVIPAEAQFSFSVSLQQRLSLGFRTCTDDRLPASPLFSLSVNPASEEQSPPADDLRVTLCWRADSRGQLSQLPEVTGILGQENQRLPVTRVSIRLNCLATAGEISAAYWTDDGRITGLNH